MRLNHRTRLALVSGATTGLLLAALFATVVGLARHRIIADKRAELAVVVKSFTPPSDPEFDLEEFHAAHPELSAAVYDATGRRLGAVGRVPPPHRRGFLEIGGRLALGIRFKGQDVAVSLDLRETERGMETLTATLVAVWFPLTLLVGGIGWATAHSVFRPLERLSAQALAMSGKDLSERLVTPDRAEFGAFAANLNRMLDRIEETVRRGERFSSDAAHELRTPLAILRTRLETTLLQARSPDQYEAAIRRSVDEIGRLTAITEALLRSARGEAVEASEIDLGPLVEEGVERWTERFAARGAQLRASVAPASARILPDEVRMVVDNLLDNALRYAPEGSTVDVALTAAEREARFEVRDRGPGVPPELGERIFDRFVRADDSRNRDSGGVGIGLAVCRQIVVARGGSMTLAPQADGGVAVGFRLPNRS